MTKTEARTVVEQSAKRCPGLLLALATLRPAPTSCLHDRIVSPYHEWWCTTCGEGGSALTDALSSANPAAPCACGMCDIHSRTVVRHHEVKLAIRDKLCSLRHAPLLRVMDAIDELIDLASKEI